MDSLPAQARPAESKSSKKKRAKAESGANGSASLTAVPQVTKEDSSLDAANADGSYEHPFVKELNKQIRNTHKKLTGMQKVDSIIAENPNTSLDDLVAQHKINKDQKASALKKPQLQQQLNTLEEQASQYRKFAADFQDQLVKQKEDLTAQHIKEMDKLKEELETQGKTVGTAELRSKLLTLTQFLRLAAAKRGVPEEADTQECLAFEGALLGLYGGDERAVDTAMKLMDGSDEHVPTTDDQVMTSVTYSDIKQASTVHAPYAVEETWANDVAQATSGDVQAQETETDPTIAHAGLTELDTTAQTNGVPPATKEPLMSPPQTGAGDEAGNAAGDQWDAPAAGTQAKGMEDSFEMIQRPQDEVDVPNPSALPADALQERSGNSWADEPPSYDNPPSGFVAGSGGPEDVKAALAAGEQQVDSSWAPNEPAQPLSASGWAEETPADTSAGAATAAQEEGDGFSQVPGRRGGRGGRGRGGDGEFRGRGRGRGGFRGDGEFRGRGRGGFRGGRGDGEFCGRGRGDGEFRGRGRGRGGGGEKPGPRGGADGAAMGT